MQAKDIGAAVFSAKRKLSLPLDTVDGASTDAEKQAEPARNHTRTKGRVLLMLGGKTYLLTSNGPALSTSLASNVSPSMFASAKIPGLASMTRSRRQVFVELPTFKHSAARDGQYPQSLHSGGVYSDFDPRTDFSTTAVSSTSSFRISQNSSFPSAYYGSDADSESGDEVIPFLSSSTRQHLSESIGSNGAHPSLEARGSIANDGNEGDDESHGPHAEDGLEDDMNNAREMDVDILDNLSSSSLATQVQLEANALITPLFYDGKVVSVDAWKVTEWQAGRHIGPTVDMLYLELTRRRTAWNRRAAEVFVQHFLALDRYKGYNEELVRELFDEYVSILQSIYRARNPPLTPVQLRRLIRRQRLVQQRIKTAIRVLRPHSTRDGLDRALRLFTAEVASGDESDDNRRFFITTVSWRSRELSDFLAALSALTLAARYSGRAGFGPGALPRPRYPSLRLESVLDGDGAPRGFPINWYNRDWLNAHPMRMAVIQPTTVVPLNLPRALAQQASRFLAVRSRNDLPFNDIDD
ncbi:hypothetical protein F5890DRAFT_1558301 [Lentinula detonsa]|uniref:Uncharacterized protein n=1 Tax=Lentinula detonsa TaxID=2804962 RepID=A0AA38PQI5_9AGAR|nr:hypothetical protein F5890DRAFT_1558301 [Lentinula detonsa]